MKVSIPLTVAQNMHYHGDIAAVSEIAGGQYILERDNYLAIVQRFEANKPKPQKRTTDNSRPQIPTPLQNAEELSAFQKLDNFGKAMWRWAKGGFEMTTREEFNRRLAICHACEFWDKDGFGGTGKCKKCGCQTELKLSISDINGCPLNKWIEIK